MDMGLFMQWNRVMAMNRASLAACQSARADVRTLAAEWSFAMTGRSGKLSRASEPVADWLNVPRVRPAADAGLTAMEPAGKDPPSPRISL